MSEHFLKDKKILFIGPMTFGYEETIKTKLEKMGAEVDLFKENRLSLLYRISRLLGPRFLDKYKNNFIKKIMNKVKNSRYDYFFLIRGDLLSKDFFIKIKQLQPSAHFIMYQWDSINLFNYLDLIDQFDIVFSFDPIDCQKHKLKYLPLFYDDDYKDLRNKISKQNIDLLFIGTLHSDRLQILKEIDKQAKENYLITSFHLYMPFFTFVKNLIINKNFQYDLGYLMFRPFNKKKLLNFLSRSKAVIDINNTFQSGLTMRTIETLGSGKKLLTTNFSIQNESFFHTNDISILDRNHSILDLIFLNKENSNNNYNELNLENWITTIFTQKIEKIYGEITNV